MRQAWLLAAMTFGCVMFAPQHARADGVTLPPSFPREEVLGDRFNVTLPERLNVELGGAAAGASNIGSLWHLDAHHSSPPSFGQPSVAVSGEGGDWVLLSYHRWMAGWGNGARSAYDGNHDAGQLYLDLQSDKVPARTLSPRANHMQMNVSWYGLGREVPVGAGPVHGSVTLFARGLVVQDFLSQALQGQVNGQAYSGMVRVVSATGGSGGVPGAPAGGATTGYGWALDVKAHLQAGLWDGFASVEGLAGQIHWSSVQFADDYVTSNQIFTDPQGLQHTIWGGSQGATWRSGLSLPIEPAYRLDLVCRTSPNWLAGCLVEQGIAAPSFGVVLPQRGPWLLYARAYPIQGMIELGSAGRGFRVSIAADDLPEASPSHLTIALTLIPTRF